MKLWKLFLICCGSMYGQESIQTDRPDKTETVFVVPKGYLQTETELVFEKINTEENKWGLLTTLWKYGLNNKTEIRLITSSFLSKDIQRKTFIIEPITLGFKSSLTEQNGILPKTSFIGSVRWDKNEINKTTIAIPSFRFTFQNQINDTSAFGYNLGIEWNNKKQEQYIYTFTYGSSITKKLNYYIETYGFLSPHQKANHNIDGGFTYLVHPNLQIDASAGIGLSSSSSPYFVGMGISYRIQLFQ